MPGLTYTIADLIRQQGQTRANALREQADLRARQQVAAGQGLGQAVANVGQTIANIPIRRQQQQVQQQELAMRSQEMQLRQMQIEQAKQAQATQAQANQAFAQFPRNPDGTFDTPSILQKLAALNAPLDAQEHFAKTLDSLNGVMASANKTRTDHLADVANTLLNLQDKNVPIDADTVHLGLAAAKSAGIATNADEQKILKLLESGTEPERVLRTIRGFGSKYAAPKYQPLPAGSGGILNEATGEVTSTGMPGRFANETDMLTAAADAKHPMHQVALDALALKAKSGGHLQAEWGILNGKPIALSFNPETGRRMDSEGNDVTAKVRPIPPTVQPVVIQTSEGPQLLNRGTATTTPIRTQAGETVQPAPTASMREKAQARELVGRSVKAIETLSKNIITKIGPAQRAEALARGAEAVFGNDPQFRTYQDARMALAGNLAVGQQGSRPSDADIKAIWLPLVPDAYRDTSESAAMKWDLIKTMSNTPPSEGGGTVAPVKKNPFRNK